MATHRIKQRGPRLSIATTTSSPSKEDLSSQKLSLLIRSQSFHIERNFPRDLQLLDEEKSSLRDKRLLIMIIYMIIQ